MGERMYGILRMTCLVATISHLDSSSSTTMLITSPAGLPCSKR